jgi:hypothetical protein
MSDTPRTKEAARVGFIEGDMLRSVFVVPLKVAEELERELVAAKADAKTANARLAVSMEAHQATILGPVAVLLRNLTQTREAAGCRPADDLPAFVGNMRTMIDAVEAMGYEWRWTKSIDADGEQVGAWVMKQVGEWVMLDAAEADANNEQFRRTDGE